MATYSIKAPNGKTYQIDGPDGASQASIQSEVLRQFPEAAGAPAATPAAPKPAPKPAASGPTTQQYLDRYNTIRNNLAKGEVNDQNRTAALARFDSDPRAQRLRQLAGLAPLSTAKQEVQKTARQKMIDAGTDLGSGATGFQSAAAGISRGLFGIPEHLAAAAERFLPSSITGNNTDASYSNILQLIRAKDTAAIGAHPMAGLGGEIGSSVVGGGAAGRVVSKVASRAAASASPIVSKLGQVVESIGTLNKGQKLKNTAKIAATGAGAGAAQAAGTGQDVTTGAAEGAVAAPLVVGGVKLAGLVTRPFRDVLRASGAGQILSRLTSATRDQLEARAAQYRAQTGAEPTLFELLPLADRNKILKQAVVGKDNVVEQTSKLIRGRAQNLGPEMSARAQAILKPQRDFIETGLRHDLAQARGGQLADGDTELIQQAMKSPTDMSTLRDVEAKAIMAPHEETPVVENLTDLYPKIPGTQGVGLEVDPEVSSVIRSAAGLIQKRPQNAGVTAGDITNMISDLKGDLSRGGNEARVAQRAIDHLQGILDEKAPEAGQAAREMSDAYAARSRMIEGMKEGNATRLRDDVQVGTSRSQARTVRNAYDTPEGAIGRSLGQSNRVLTDLGGGPEDALRATVKMSRGTTTRAMGENVGSTEAIDIGQAARAQDESAQALSAASAKAQGGAGEGADAETLVQAIAGLHPSSFITTKAGAMRKLLDMTYIPESRARTIVDMVFSQDSALRTRALKAIGNEPNGAKFLRYLAGTAGQLTVDANATPPEGTDSEQLTSPVITQPASDEIVPVDESPAAAPAEPAAAPEAAQSDSPYAPALQALYANENPDLIDLVQRVKHQESGKQGQAAVSPKGAVGTMQVMPATGPEAARLAGLPWDPEAFHNDAAYNELLGIAYLSELLRKYDGDVGRALAAYNAGAGRVDNALASGGSNWLASLPAETQDYVARVG